MANDYYAMVAMREFAFLDQVIAEEGVRLEQELQPLIETALRSLRAQGGAVAFAPRRQLDLDLCRGGDTWQIMAPRPDGKRAYGDPPRQAQCAQDAVR